MKKQSIETISPTDIVCLNARKAKGKRKLTQKLNRKWHINNQQAEKDSDITMNQEFKTKKRTHFYFSQI